MAGRAGWLPRALLLAAAVAGTVGTGRLAVAGRGLGSALAARDLWPYGSAPRLLVPGDDVGRAAAGTFTALGLWVVGWLLAGLAVRSGASLRSLVAVGVLWALPLLLAPPLFSPDVFSYTAIGAAVHHGVDPYLSGPAAAGDIAAVRGADPFWRETPTPYGPPFLALLAVLSRLFDEDVFRVVVAIRVLSVGGWAVCGVFVVRLARRWGIDPRQAVWLGVVNPLVLVSAVSADHNDVLMMALVLPGLWLASTGRPLWGLVLCGAAAGIKVTALIAVLVIGVDLARRQTGWGRRLGALVGAGVVGAGTFVVLAQLAGFGWGWLGNLSVPGRAAGPLTPLRALAVTLDPADPPLAAVRVVGVVLGVLAGVLLLGLLPRWGPVRVTGALFAVAVVVGPVLWPWYLLAPVMVLAAAGSRRAAQLLGCCSIVLLFATLPGGQSILPLLPYPLGHRLVAGALVAAAGWYALAEVRSGRRRSAASRS